MLGGERLLTRDLARYWWVFLISGTGWLFVAWLVLRLNETSLRTVGVLLGVVFLASGVNEAAVSGLMTTRWRLWHGLMAFIFLLGGLWALIRPVDTFFSLVSVLGLVLIFYGVFEISRSIALEGVSPYWWLGVISGILLLLLAFWVSGSDRVYALSRRTYLVLFWVGFMALFKGITQIMMAFGIRHGTESALPSD